MDAHDDARVIPLETRLIGAIPASPVVAGCGVAAVLVAGAVLCFVLSGETIATVGPDGIAFAPDFVTAAVVSLLVGYTMAAGRYLAVTIARDLIEAGRLRPEALAPENATWLFGSTRRFIVRSRVVGVVAAMVALLLMHRVGAPLVGRALFTLDPARAWTVVLTPLLFFMLARAAYMTTTSASTVGRLDRALRIEPGGIDLLDMRAHLVEGRVGLRLALVWIVGSTISSLLFYDPDLLLPFAPVMVLGLAVAALALVLPVRRLHRRIRDAKATEMAAVQVRLSAARDAAMRGDSGAEGRLADLLAYYDHLDDVREWPFDNQTLSRFVLYLLIPLGSWLGGALVERVVSSVLD
jgi:hypothetical protein